MAEIIVGLFCIKNYFDCYQKLGFFMDSQISV